VPRLSVPGGSPPYPHEQGSGSDVAGVRLGHGRQSQLPPPSLLGLGDNQRKVRLVNVGIVERVGEIGAL
jgi:hypothetical protein